MNKFFTFIIVTVVFSVFLYLSDFFHFRATKEYTLYIKNGDTLSSTAYALHSNNVITANISAIKAYYTLWKTIHGCEKIYIGEYHINNEEGYGSIINKLCNGISVLKTITIREGLETREIVDLINKNNDLIGRNVVSFEEGIFLPETYSFNSGTEKYVVFNKMKQDMQTFINNEWKKRNTEIDKYIKNQNEAIILASIVEKEAQSDDERPFVASVFLNRLKKNMRLQSDPTVMYEVTNGRYKLQRPINRKDINLTGKYNTYRKNGLPSSPICNPGKKSILAVLHPENTDYLFFFAKPDLQGLLFAKTYNEHLKNIKYVSNKN